MDPHEEAVYERLKTAFDKIKQHLPSKSEDITVRLQDISPKRSSRIAAYVRAHKGTLIGGTVVAFVVALCSEAIRRANGKP